MSVEKLKATFYSKQWLLPSLHSSVSSATQAGSGGVQWQQYQHAEPKDVGSILNHDIHSFLHSTTAFASVIVPEVERQRRGTWVCHTEVISWSSLAVWLQANPSRSPGLGFLLKALDYILAAQCSCLLFVRSHFSSCNQPPFTLSVMYFSRINSDLWLWVWTCDWA